jgi:hypothetical protein
MKNKSAPRHAKTRASGSVRGASNKRLIGHADSSVTPRIIAAALALASLGAATAGLAGHGSAGHATRQQSGYTSQTASVSPTGTTRVPNIPWMY